MICERGDIVLGRFPFTDQNGTKARPLLALSPGWFNSSAPDVIVAALSSRESSRTTDRDVLISSNAGDFAETGLRQSSVVFCGKIATISNNLIFLRLGVASAETMNLVDERIGRHLGVRPN